MSFWQQLRNFLTTTEADVVEIIVRIKTDAEVALSDIDKAMHWIAANAPTIAADIQQVVQIVETVGLAGNPEVAAAVAAANASVVALNAFAAAENSGKSSPQAVLAGYVAVKQAQASAASAAAAAVKTP